MNLGHNATYPENGTYVSTVRVPLLTCSRGWGGWGAVAVGQDTGVTLGKTALRCSQIREHKRLHQGVKRVAGREKPTSVAHVAAKGDVGAERLPFISSVLSEKPPLSHTACFWSWRLATKKKWLLPYPTMFQHNCLCLFSLQTNTNG